MLKNPRIDGPHCIMFIIQKVLNFFFLNRAQCFLDTVWDCTKVSLQKIKPHLVTPMYFVIVTPITYYFWVILRQMEQYRKLVLAQNQTTRTGTSVLWRSRNLFSQICNIFVNFEPFNASTVLALNFFYMKHTKWNNWIHFRNHLYIYCKILFDNKNLNLLQALLVPFSLAHPVKEGKSWTVSFVIHILPNGNLSD